VVTARQNGGDYFIRSFSVSDRIVEDWQLEREIRKKYQ
jgi:hypothetical protein